MPAAQPPDFGTLLRRLRRAAGLSQEELAERARMSAAAVSALERGSRKAPYRDTVALLIEALGAEGSDRAELTEAAELARRKAAASTGPTLPERWSEGAASPAEPPLRSNLPAQVTSFFGRDRELAELEALLGKHRLVTLVGTGGVGKTRLSLHLGERVLGAYPDGVWFVEFAPLSDPQFVAATIASTAGLGSISELDPVRALVGALRAKRMLLILDNCEHLVDQIAQVADTILRGAPHVTLLASSRQGLEVQGERTYRVPPLTMPSSAERRTLRAHDAHGFSAVELFAERAVSVGKGFELTDDSAPIVADIVARLDGIPLAIELAAARVKIFSPHELRTRLNDRFRILVGGSRTALPRQQTLHALIDWSYDLLSAKEQALLQRLSVFVDGWTLEAAEAVCADDQLEEDEVLDNLVSLVDKSLVVAEPSGDAMRYRLLESTRAFAHAKLVEAGSHEQAALQHLRYFSDLFAAVGEAYEQFPREADVLALVVELNNARAALDFGATHDPETAARLFVSTVLWGLLGHRREMIERAQQLIPLVTDLRILSRLWERASTGFNNSGYYAQGVLAGMEAVAAAISCGDLVIRAYAVCKQIHSLVNSSGDYAEAKAWLRSYESTHTLSPRLELWFALAKAHVAVAERDAAAQLETYGRLRELERRYGNARGEMLATAGLAEAQHALGDTAEALRIAQEFLTSETSVRDMGQPRMLALNSIGYLIALDRLQEARAAIATAIKYFDDPSEDNDLAVLAEHAALLAALEGDTHLAARLAGFVDFAYTNAGYRREHTERVTAERLDENLHASLAAEDRHLLMGEGRAWNAEQVLAACAAEAGDRTGDDSIDLAR